MLYATNFVSIFSFPFKSCLGWVCSYGEWRIRGKMFLPHQGFSIYIVRPVIFSCYLGVMSYLGRPSHSVLEIYESLVSSSSSMVLFMSIKSVPLPLRSSLGSNRMIKHSPASTASWRYCIHIMNYLAPSRLFFSISFPYFYFVVLSLSRSFLALYASLSSIIFSLFFHQKIKPQDKDSKLCCFYFTKMSLHLQHIPTLKINTGKNLTSDYLSI